MKALDRTLLVLLSGTLLLKCSMEPLKGGSGDETTNGRVTGVVVMQNGSSASNTAVRLFPENFDPVKDTPPQLPASATTDTLGRYTFSNVPSGDYSILAIQRGNGFRTFISDIHVNNDTVTTPTRTLRVPGSIIVSLPADVNSAIGYVFIPGTPYFTFRTESAGVVQLDSVPAEIVPAVSYASTKSPGQTVIRYNVAVSPGDTTVIWNPLWRHARTLVLNTSASGADVAGKVLNFPVLVRMNSGNFNFSQAQVDGADIRFTKPDNTYLPYEIERWDLAAKTAEIWVKIDTVFGNDTAQSITIYWGNPAAVNSSNSTAVFDTAAGFQGVWHLSDNVNDPVRDATVNGYHGLSPDTARPQVAEGMVGRCRVFDGATNYITMPYTANSKLNFPENGFYTVSAWVKIDSLDDSSHLIVAKGYEQYFLRFTYFPTNSPLWEFSEFGATDSWNACTAAATSGQWVLLTGVGQGNRQSLYCNGVVVDSTPNTYQNSSLSRNTSYDLSIGKFLEMITLPNNNEGYCFFKGSIDEVRIMSAARSSDWVRLSYMNQRTDDRLVVFK